MQRTLLLALAAVLLAGIPLGAGAQREPRCRCARDPSPIAGCASETSAMSFDEVLRSRASLEGRLITVRATLHTLYGCADRMTTTGCIPMCTGQVALIERRGRDDRIIYLGTGYPSGALECPGPDPGCPCCVIDARDQTVLATGILRTEPTLRLETPTLCQL